MVVECAQNSDDQNIPITPLNKNLKSQKTERQDFQNFKSNESNEINWSKIQELEKKLIKNVQILQKLQKGQQENEKLFLSDEVSQILESLNNSMKEFENLKNNLLNQQISLMGEFQDLKNLILKQNETKNEDIPQILKNQYKQMDEIQGLKNNQVSNQTENKLDDILCQLQENQKNNTDTEKFNEINENIQKIREIIEQRNENQLNLNLYDSDNKFQENSKVNNLSKRLVKLLVKAIEENKLEQKSQEDEIFGQQMSQMHKMHENEYDGKILDQSAIEMHKMQEMQPTDAASRESEFKISDLYELNLESVEELSGSKKGAEYRVILKTWTRNWHVVEMMIPSSAGQQLMKFMRGKIDENRMIYKVFQKVIENFGLGLDKMVISDLQNGVYVSKLEFRSQNGENWVVEMRPSDGFNIALRLKSPVYICKNLIED